VTAESTGLGWPEQSDTTDQDLPHGLGWPGAGPSPEPTASPVEPAVPRETAVHRVRTAADIVAEAAGDTTGGGRRHAYSRAHRATVPRPR